MVNCSALTCTNKSANGFRMFRFPRDESRCKMWLKNCGRTNWFPGAGARLCEVHFETSQWELHRQDGWKKLKQTAIPTLFDLQQRKSKQLKFLVLKDRNKEDQCEKPSSKKVASYDVSLPHQSLSNSCVTLLCRVPDSCNNTAVSTNQNVTVHLQADPSSSVDSTVPFTSHKGEENRLKRPLKLDEPQPVKPNHESPSHSNSLITAIGRSEQTDSCHYSATSINQRITACLLVDPSSSSDSTTVVMSYSEQNALADKETETNNEHTTVHTLRRGAEAKNAGEQASSVTKVAKETLDAKHVFLKALELQPKPQPKDECGMYCDLLAEQLRKFDMSTKEILIQKIDGLIFEARTKCHQFKQAFSHYSHVYSPYYGFTPLFTPPASPSS